MFNILQRKLMKAGSSASRLKFEADLGPVQIGNRYLLLDGKRAYNLGTNCQTCATLFQRLPGANQSLRMQEAVEALAMSLIQLRAYSGDLKGGDKDMSVAEDFGRKGSSPGVLKRDLQFHADLLSRLNRPEEARAKLDEAAKL